MQQLRQAKILELISDHAIETQEELLAQLREAGFEVTQATVSRDIKKLRLYKTHDANGNYCYAVNAPNQHRGMNGILSETVLSVKYSFNNVVIHCRSGMAQAVCQTIDDMRLSQVLGTIGGDDTILIVTEGTEQSEQLCDIINDLIK
ncbi:MAG: arginine repressor [Firmicutes bacterium]|nr:arginine repressor [Bacillota bacterium]